MLTISKLCKKYGLSRSTLLYYDRIGLLKPSARTDSNYRSYSADDDTRLGIVCAFREAGVSLEQIKRLLDSGEAEEYRILESRLKDINSEIRYLRLQQGIIVEILKAKYGEREPAILDLNLIMSLFRAAGVGDEMQDRFHAQFEKNRPDMHQFFLEFLGIPPEQIERIRRHYSNLG